MSEAIFLSEKRSGDRPHCTTSNPHSQLSQNAPVSLQEKVFAFASTLEGVVIGPSRVSVPGARGFHTPDSPSTDRHAFLIASEFAHLHPQTDGSLHLTLPPAMVDQTIANGWAELHPLAGKHGLPGNIVMVYGPRDEAELTIINAIISTSHAFAMGRA